MEDKKFFVQSLQHPIRVDGVVSVFYSDISQNFRSCGEKHDCWELVYVDNGHIHVETEKRTYFLAQGQITFHAPMEYHRHISPISQSSLCICAFTSHDPLLYTLSNGPYILDESQRKLLAQTLKYGTNIFSSLVDAKDALYLIKKPDVTAVEEQIFTNYLELFLLFCLRHLSSEKTVSNSVDADMLAKSRISDLGKRALDYLMQHLYENVSIPKICKELQCSKTTLSTAFKAYTGVSVIPYFNRLKIEAAKEMIRSENVSITEIASRLNFCNLNYFSTAFKQYTGMYPREYAKSIKIYNSVYLLNTEHASTVKHDRSILSSITKTGVADEAAE